MGTDPVAVCPRCHAAADAATQSLVYLGTFIALLLVYWSTFRTRVPLYLSGPRVWRVVQDLLPAALPALISRLRIAWRRLPNCHISWGSYWPLDLKSHDVMFAFCRQCR